MPSGPRWAPCRGPTGELVPLAAVRLAMGAAARSPRSAFDAVEQPAGVRFRWAPHLLTACDHIVFERLRSRRLIAPPPSWDRAIPRCAPRKHIGSSRARRVATERTCGHAGSARWPPPARIARKCSGRAAMAAREGRLASLRRRTCARADASPHARLAGRPSRGARSSSLSSRRSACSRSAPDCSSARSLCRQGLRRQCSRTNLHAPLAARPRSSREPRRRRSGPLHPAQGARFRLFAEVSAPGVTLLPEAARLAR